MAHVAPYFLYQLKYLIRFKYRPRISVRSSSIFESRLKKTQIMEDWTMGAIWTSNTSFEKFSYTLRHKIPWLEAQLRCL